MFPANLILSNSLSLSLTKLRSYKNKQIQKESVEEAWIAEEDTKMLWVDKYRPKTLDNITAHQHIAQNLKKLVFTLFLSFFIFFIFFNCVLGFLKFWFFALGDGAGLPTFALLWPTGFRQENPNHGPSSTDVWPHCWKGLLLLLDFLSWVFSLYGYDLILRLYHFYLFCFSFHCRWKSKIRHGKSM